MAANDGTVIVFNAAQMGRGDEGLGEKLAGNFLRTLATLDAKPDAIVFYNGAVKLLAPEASTVDALRELEAGGVDLLACVTCLEFFALTDRVAVGHVSNMREIAQRLVRATKVITV